MLVRSWFKDATILTFGDSGKALEELCRTDPDVLITDDMMPTLTGYDIIENLMDRNTTYPILMVSGLSGCETWVQEHAGYGLNISFLSKPFTVEQLKGWMTAHLGQVERP